MGYSLASPPPAGPQIHRVQAGPILDRIVAMPDPAYILVLEVRPDFLHALIKGKEDSYETTMSAVTEIARFCHDRKIEKVLVEHAIPGRLTTMEVFKMASQLPDLYGDVIVGFVIHLHEIPDNPRFLETVAVNRGGLGRLFGNVREAEEWLRSI